jgi:hypothetical protein
VLPPVQKQQKRGPVKEKLKLLPESRIWDHKVSISGLFDLAVSV